MCSGCGRVLEYILQKSEMCRGDEREWGLFWLGKNEVPRALLRWYLDWVELWVMRLQRQKCSKVRGECA